jgi:predicted DNA repair protein MutK
MKGLSVAGTAAMFLVGGSILTHGFAPLHHFIEVTHAAGGGRCGRFLAALTPLLMDAVVGLVAGALVLLAGQPGQAAAASRLRRVRLARAGRFFR